MTLTEKLLTEKIIAAKPDGTSVEGSFVCEDGGIFLVFDGHKKLFAHHVSNINYQGLILAATHSITTFYEGITEWAVMKGKYSY